MNDLERIVNALVKPDSTPELPKELSQAVQTIREDISIQAALVQYDEAIRLANSKKKGRGRSIESAKTALTNAVREAATKLGVLDQPKETIKEHRLITDLEGKLTFFRALQEGDKFYAEITRNGQAINDILTFVRFSPTTPGMYLVGAEDSTGNYYDFETLQINSVRKLNPDEEPQPLVWTELDLPTDPTQNEQFISDNLNIGDKIQYNYKDETGTTLTVSGYYCGLGKNLRAMIVMARDSEDPDDEERARFISEIYPRALTSLKFIRNTDSNLTHSSLQDSEEAREIVLPKGRSERLSVLRQNLRPGDQIMLQLSLHGKQEGKYLRIDEHGRLHFCGKFKYYDVDLMQSISVKNQLLS